MESHHFCCRKHGEIVRPKPNSYPLTRAPAFCQGVVGACLARLQPQRGVCGICVIQGTIKNEVYKNVSDN